LPFSHSVLLVTCFTGSFCAPCDERNVETKADSSVESSIEEKSPLPGKSDCWEGVSSKKSRQNGMASINLYIFYASNRVVALCGFRVGDVQLAAIVRTLTQFSAY